MKNQSITLTFITLFYCISFSYAQNKTDAPSTIANEDEYLAKILVAKFKNSDCIGKQDVLSLLHPFIKEKLNIVSAKRKFPSTKAPDKKMDAQGNQLVDLTNIYDLEYAANVAEKDAVSILFSTGLFEYVELQYISKPLYVINDSFANASQWHLNKIKAFQAWDINQGDTNVVIGITDTGFSLQHPDLLATIKKNYDDTIDGVDNDGDGYIDNFEGWDMFDNDNNLNHLNNLSNDDTHGTTVTMLISAEVNNNYGCAGIAYNCRFLPVKCSNNITGVTPKIVRGHEGIVYAADHGANVINCSWGNTTWTNCGCEVVRYATINKNALIVAAAGNDNNAVPFYPASCPYALSISSVDSTDRRTNNSYGTTVDLSAPGFSVYTSGIYNGTVMFSPPVANGSSFANPIVSGVAGLVKTQFPYFNALQIGEQIKATTDPTDGITGNIPNMMGAGRVNAFNAVTDSSNSSIVMAQIKITDNNGDLMRPGSTVYISGVFTNYLFPSGNLIATLSSPSPLVSVVNSNISIGVLGMMATFNNVANPFTVTINNQTFLNQPINLLLTITDGNSISKQWISFNVNRDYVKIDTNDVVLTLASRGRIGYNQNYQIFGDGFTHNGGKSLLYTGGLMIGVSPTQVSDGVYADTIGVSDNDFSVVNVIARIPDTVSNFDVQGKFNDNGAGVTAIGVSVLQKGHAWNTTDNRNFVMLRYHIINTGISPLTNLYAGIFADWSINDSIYCRTFDKANEDVNCRMGYAYGSGQYVGIKLLSQGAFNHYAIDKTADSTSINIGDGYAPSEKFISLSTSRSTAGGQNGNDIAQVVSTVKPTLIVGDTMHFDVALIAGASLAELLAGCMAAQTMYNNITLFVSALGTNASEPTISVFPNPANGTLNIQLFNTMLSGMVNMSLQNIVGQEVFQNNFTAINNPNPVFTIDVSHLEQGIYILKLNGREFNFTRKVVVSK